MPAVAHWLYVLSGLSSANSPFYLFWSGIGADLARIALLGGIVQMVQRSARHHRELLELHERHHRERNAVHMHFSARKGGGT